MRLIHQIALLGLASYLGTSGLFAQTQKQDELAEQIARLPWDAVVDVSAAASSGAQIVVLAHYVKPGVVEDTDTDYIHVHPVKTTVDKEGRMMITSDEVSIHRSKIRDQIGGSCIGSGRLTKADKSGFDYQLTLTWERGPGTEKKFGETFHCLWVQEQAFKKNGFTITITTKLK